MGRSVLEYWHESAGMGVDNDITFFHAGVDLEQGLDAGPSAAMMVTLLAGSIAGIISRTCTAPFDRLKMCLQVDPVYRGLGVSGGMRRIFMDGKTHRVWSAKGIEGYAKASGWRGVLAGLMAFYRGNGTNVAKIMPETAIKFLAYETCRTWVCGGVNAAPTEKYNMSPSQRFMCGAIAGMTAQSIIYPLEVTKTRLAVSEIGTYSGISHCLFKVSRQEGARALYRGLGASLVGIVPFSGVDMGVYFYLREQVVPLYRGGRSVSRAADVGTMLLCGCTSSVCGMLVAYPLHLVRTRLQAQGLNGMRTYSGIVGCLQETVRKDGFVGLYTGFGANLLKAIPSISISYAIFETTKAKLLS